VKEYFSDNPELSIIIPTYNEAENISVLVPYIHNLLVKKNIKYEVIIVDDDSPDNTGAVGKKLANKYPLKVIIRKNQKGLSSAVLDGFKVASSNVLIVMDADGSHPVEAIPEMFKIIKLNRADLVIGSRYHKNSEFIDWPWYRDLLSRSAFLLTRGLVKVTDPTTGFFGIKRELVEKIQLNPIGWKIALEIMVKANHLGTKEIPITFKPRMYGESKLSFREHIKFLWHLITLYAYKYKTISQFIKFGIVGSTGILVDTGVVILTKSYLGLDLRVCAAMGFIVASTTNFFGNLLWAFRSSRKLKVEKKVFYRLNQYVRFLIISVVGLCIKIALVHLLITYVLRFFYIDYRLINLIGILFASISNFLGYKFIVFNRRFYKIRK